MQLRQELILFPDENDLTDSDTRGHYLNEFEELILEITKTTTHQESFNLIRILRLVTKNILVDPRSKVGSVSHPGWKIIYNFHCFFLLIIDHVCYINSAKIITLKRNKLYNE